MRTDMGSCRRQGRVSPVKVFFCIAAVWLVLSISNSAGAWISVPDQGDTGWRTYTYTAGPGGLSGTAGFVVSNVVDDSAYSELLIDNLSHGGGSNRSFEIGNYTGYSLLGDSYGEVATSVIAAGGNLYTPTHGDNMSHQLSLASGLSTAAFRNANNQPGTSGCILETAISLPPGGQFTFNWAFLANDASPWNDFSLFYVKDGGGSIVFSEGLAQIGAVPVPSTFLLVATGLLGLFSLRRRSAGG